jgi:hypothetical protein
MKKRVLSFQRVDFPFDIKYSLSYYAAAVTPTQQRQRLHQNMPHHDFFHKVFIGLMQIN